MAWTNTGVDAVITNAPAYLHGLVLLASAAGGDATLYDGTDAGAGRKIGTFKGGANLSNQVVFYPPLPCERGLFLDVGSNVTEVLVHWDPIPRGVPAE